MAAMRAQPATRPSSEHLENPEIGDAAHRQAVGMALLRELNVRPHVARNSSARRSAIDGRTTRHPGYATSQRLRKRIEEAFGWIKTVAGLKKVRFRGLARVDLAFTFVAAAYNLVRLPRLLAGAPSSRRRWTAGSSAAGGSSRRTSGIATTSTWSPPPP
jgi:hypothetical protein